MAAPALPRAGRSPAARGPAGRRPGVAARRRRRGAGHDCAKLTGQARDDIARTLGVPAPSRVTLRFHPTTASYERATGQPWFTSGAVVNGELHLLPLAVLRDRGVLERTIRHELVHVMTDAVLGKRPAWVREGAAIYFAGRPDWNSPSGPQTRAPVRPTAELLQPVSVGALSNAYARARACFARQIAGGKSWRDVDTQPSAYWM